MHYVGQGADMDKDPVDSRCQPVEDEWSGRRSSKSISSPRSIRPQRLSGTDGDGWPNT